MRNLSLGVLFSSVLAGGLALVGCGGTELGSDQLGEEAAFLGTPAECTSQKKVLVCHVPPGNPANAHNICIGKPAVKHHLKNHEGDKEGGCGPASGDPNGGDPSNPGGDPTNPAGDPTNPGGTNPDDPDGDDWDEGLGTPGTGDDGDSGDGSTPTGSTTPGGTTDPNAPAGSTTSGGTTTDPNAAGGTTTPGSTTSGSGDPASGTCRSLGLTCGSGATCCTGLVCSAGYCRSEIN